MTPNWSPMDPLGEALHVLRMSGTYYSRCEFTAPWGLVLPAVEDSSMFHILISGRCWLEVDGVEPRPLRQGDLVLVPHGEGHRLASEPGLPGLKLVDVPREEVSERYEILRQGGGGAPTRVVCGTVRFYHPAAQNLINVLPRVISVGTIDSPRLDWLQSTLRFLAAEARELRPGGETVITRLADILVILAIRSWIELAPAARTGWIGGLRDRQIGRAIRLIHREPARRWTVALLAGEAAMSRSAFVARFTNLVGEPPMRYVARWRMHLAIEWLKTDGASVGEVAMRLGYQSEAAFSRAFKRFVGVSPGAIRRHPAS
jgi:AraC-like DNA-binding protein/mannose-6-phosphate isomerase-like protein (cupin superfamily)